MKKIKPHKLYCDEKSVELSYPYREKRKYKITGEKFWLADKYIFILTTSHKSYCKEDRVLAINHNEWGVRDINKIRKFSIFRSPTYINVQNVNVCDSKEILEKIKLKIFKELCNLPKSVIDKIQEKMKNARVSYVNFAKIISAKFSFGLSGLPEVTEIQEIRDMFGID